MENHYLEINHQLYQKGSCNFDNSISLSTCKKEDDPIVVVNASVADSSMGGIDFKAGSYAVGAAVTFSATPQAGTYYYICSLHAGMVVLLL